MLTLKRDKQTKDWMVLLDGQPQRWCKTVAEAVEAKAEIQKALTKAIELHG